MWKPILNTEKEHDKAIEGSSNVVPGEINPNSWTARMKYERVVELAEVKKELMRVMGRNNSDSSVIHCEGTVSRRMCSS